MDRGWPVGEVLGSEAELVAKYGVSRAVFREAVRIVEHHNVARMRRGPGGGLVVTAPGLEAVQRPAALYLAHAKTKVADVQALRRAIELQAVRGAVEHLDESGIARLRSVMDDERQLSAGEARRNDLHALHVVLADLSENPAVVLTMAMLLAMTSAQPGNDVLSADDLATALAHHDAIVEAVVAGDVALAQHRMGRFLDFAERGEDPEHVALPASASDARD